MWRAVLVAGLVWAGGASSQSSTSYERGANDRATYERWFADLSGDYKNGAEFWAKHRSRPGEADCTLGQETQSSAWHSGCLDAKRSLEPVDQGRLSDPNYRKGWNSYQQFPSPATQQQAQPADEQSPPPYCSNGQFLPPAQVTRYMDMYTQQRMSADCSSYVRALDERKEAEMRAEEVQKAQIAASKQAALDRVDALNRRLTKQRQEDAESSANNVCKTPSVARDLMERFDTFRNAKLASLEAIDLEHITTVSHSDDGRLSCHATFLLSNGSRITGTMSRRPNVVGDMIIEFQAD